MERGVLVLATAEGSTRALLPSDRSAEVVGCCCLASACTSCMISLYRFNRFASWLMVVGVAAALLPESKLREE